MKTPLLIQRLLSHVPLKQQIVSSAAWTFVIRIMAMVMGVAVSALLARLLPPEEVGTYFLIFSVVSIIAIVAEIGLVQAVVRLVAESVGTHQPGRARRAIVITLRYGLFGSIAAASALYFGLGNWLAVHVFHSPAMGSVVVFIALWVAALTNKDLLSAIFRGLHEIRWSAAFNGLVMTTISAAALGILLLYRGHTSLSEVLLLTVGAGLLALCMAAVIIYPKITALRGTSDLRAREVMAIAWPSLFTSTVNVLLMRGDIWILGMFRSPDEVAIYGAAGKLMQLVYLPMLVVSAALPPIIAQLYAQKKTVQLEYSLRFAASLAAVPAILVLIVLTIWGGPILASLFGEFYAAGALVLLILNFGQLANAWTGACVQLLVMTGHQKALLVFSMAAGLLALGLAWLTAPRFGMIGVAVSFSLAVGVLNLLAAWYGQRRVGIRTYAGIPWRWAPRSAIPTPD